MIQNTTDRQLRVFLSSTFSDMQEERDVLVKLFRELATEGQRRGVDIKLVDLRWGVTDDQRRTGRVISTCLQEIDSSRPFFIGILGDRYGWIPTSEELRINPELRERYPVVDRYCEDGLSMTEIEMRYGVLDTESKDDSLFLIKRNAKHENERHHRLSEELTSGKVNHAYYSSVEELAETTRKAMMEVLDRKFPRLSDIPEWEQYEVMHANIAKGQRSGYVPYGDYLARLDQWLRSDSQHLVVTGESGSGKSALISEWIGRNAFGDYKVMYHFIGNGLAEGSHLEVQRHFLSRLEHEYGLEPTPEKHMLSNDDDYVMELEEALKEADQRGDKWLILVDGLDHLQQDAMTKLMSWFPELPSSAKALFSTVGTDLTYKRLHDAMGYEEMAITPLSKENIEEIATHYLANVGKSLDSNLIDMISSNTLFSNPLLLRLLLDELVTYGVHEQIGAHVFNYTTSKDKTEFYGKIIAHAEEYYGEDLIKDILTLIVTTKNGLSDTSVIEILGLDPLDWAMAHAGLQRLFTFIGGRYAITNRDIIDALNSRYEYEKDDYRSTIGYKQRTLAYLEKKGEDIDELAYLYWSTGDMERLHSILADPDNVVGLLLRGDKWFAMYWEAVMEETDHTPYEYLDMDFKDLPDWDADEQLEFLAQMLAIQLGDNSLAVELQEKGIQILLAKDADNPDILGVVASKLMVIAQHHMDMGNLEEAEEKISEAEDLCMRIGETDISYLYLTKGNLATATGEHEEALQLYLRALDMEEASGEEITWKYLNNTGLAYLNLGLPEEALEMFERALEALRKGLVDDTVEGALIMQNLGLTYQNMGDLDKAEPLYLRALDIYQENLETPGVGVGRLYSNLGLLYLDREKYDEAKSCLEEARDIFAMLGDEEGRTFAEEVLSDLE